MTFGNGNYEIRKAELADLNAIKRLADTHRHELGFVMCPALKRSIQRRELLLASGDNGVTGFVEYHHRRDQQTTLYHIAVKEEMRRHGIGRLLVESLKREAQAEGKEVIRLKCPEALPANAFYARLGWKRIAVEEGKTRSLAVWELPLQSHSP